MTVYTPIPAPSGGSVTIAAVSASEDTSGASDLARLQALIDAATPGATINVSAGTFYVSEPIVLKNGVSLRGAGTHATVLKQADGADLDGVIVGEEWAGGNNSSDAPLDISHLQVDGNRTNNAGLGHGIIITSYWTRVHDVLVRYCDGSGIMVSATESDDTEITNTLVETRIRDCELRDIAGHGIWVRDDSPTTQTVTDGFVTDCTFHDVDSHGINVDSSAGWKIRGNHFYGVKQSCIRANRAYQTTITDNYFETWGLSTTAGTYCAIDCPSSIGVLNISGNHGFHAGSIDSGVTVRGILVTGSTGATTRLTLVGNEITGATATIATSGIRIATNGATAVVNVTESSNSMSGWDYERTYNVNSGTINRTPRNRYVTTPTDTVRENFPERETGLANVGPLSSGRLHMELVWYEAGEVVTSIAWASNTTAGASLTNRWAALFDINRNRLAISADDTSASWTGSTEQTFTMTAAYTIPTTGFYYHGLCVVGTTVPTLRGYSALSTPNGKTPIAAGSSSTGLTNPASCPSTAGALTAVNVRAWTCSR